MNDDLIAEIKGRTTRLRAQEQNKKQLDSIELRLTRLFNQRTYTDDDGRKRLANKQYKLRIGLEIIRSTNKPLDISKDIETTLKLLD